MFEFYSDFVRRIPDAVTFRVGRRFLQEFLLSDNCPVFHKTVRVIGIKEFLVPAALKILEPYLHLQM